MAEQELADNTEAMAAVMAAAEVAGEIDMVTSERRDNADQASSIDHQPADVGTASGESAGEVANTYLMVKELRAISRARSLRLQAADIIVAIDGLPFHKDIETFLDIMFECDPENGSCLLYTSPSPRDRQKSRMPSSA